MGKYVLITGASSGLGKETAKKLAKEGFRVFAGVRKEEDKITLEALNPNIKAVFLDVTDEQSLNSAKEEISKTTDTLFALVNNAGIAIGGSVEYLPVELLQKQFEVNVFGAVRTAQKFLPFLQKSNDSRIVNISSMASYGIFPFVSPYCVSKKAMDMFFNSLLIEAKIPGLKVISIKPGVVATPIWEKSVNFCEQNPEHLCEEGKKKYEKEFDFLMKNARSNTNKGLKPQDIADTVYKALVTKRPKLSYNVGKDSYFARFVSLLPQGVTNFCIKTALSKRIKNL